jgi:hypothetical protein
VGGTFDAIAGVTAHNIAKWDGQSWSPLGSGIGLPAPGGGVYALAQSGDDLYVGGSFVEAGGTAALNIAKWDGERWSALGDGLGPVRSYIDYNGVFTLAVSGQDLYAGGRFVQSGGTIVSNIAKWDGEKWSPLDAGLNGGVGKLAFFREELYATGGFTMPGSVAKWDAHSHSWSPVGSGLVGSAGPMASFGTNLYVGSEVNSSSGTYSYYLAKWDGQTWSSTRAPLDGRVTALVAFESYLYVGGTFRKVFSEPANRIAKYDGGVGWSTVGSGLKGFPLYYGDLGVSQLAIADSHLYVIGFFSNAGGQVCAHLAKTYLQSDRRNLAPFSGLSYSPMTGFAFSFNEDGDPGAQQYRVQVTVDFINWTDLELVETENGQFHFNDPLAGPAPRGFYRVVKVGEQ